MVSLIHSSRKKKSTATSVPTCSATSTASPGSGQPKIHGASARCAELEIGRNSASPCRMPSTSAWKTVISWMWEWSSCAGDEERSHRAHHRQLEECRATWPAAQRERGRERERRHRRHERRDEQRGRLHQRSDANREGGAGGDECGDEHESRGAYASDHGKCAARALVGLAIIE